jgi:hypothetical protein
LSKKLRTKWKNRTREDQDRIFDEQKARRETGNKSSYERDDGKAGEIYRNGAIPIMCMKHGWVESERYVVDKIPHPLDVSTKIQGIIGTCPACNKTVRRAIPLGDELLMMVPVIMKLEIDGRLVDKRKSGK